MSEDSELLRRYLSGRSEEAFGLLVQRHLGLVYHTARRHLGGDAHAAQDVAQLVFTDLARKAGTLLHHDRLGGWLHRSARFTALKRRRSDRRRQVREEEARRMQALVGECACSSEWVRDLVEDGLKALRPRDREAVVMHFLEGRDLAAVGARLDITPQSARSLIGRALARMHAALAGAELRWTQPQATGR